MDGKPFIKVTIGEGDAADEYVYTPKEGAANLKAGNQYTYNITVKWQELVVTTSPPSSEWTKDGDDVTVTGTEK